MAAGRGGLGWVVLAVALAVPGGLFYNWWSGLKAEHDHAISIKASKQAGSGVFQTSPPQTGHLINPMAASTSAPAGFPPAVAAQTAPTAAGAMPTAAGAMPTAPAGTLATTPAGTKPLTMPGTSSAVALSTVSTVVLSRDPMMSPLDAVRLQEAALAEEARLAELAEASKPHPVAKRKIKKQAPIETKIELQGIVAKADGDNLAIINGSTINPGESFEVDNYKGKVKVLKITSSEVVMAYEGRKFKLSVNTE
jgi:hypothetical protein